MERRSHCRTAEEVLAEQGSSMAGLEQDEAQARLARFGPNELAARRGPSALRILARQFKNFMVIVLIAAALVSVVIGALNGTSDEYLDAGVIALIVIINAVLGFLQEHRAEKALQALKDLASPRATALRSGQEVQLPARELVPGDVVLLATGDRVPADGRVLESASLRINEAPLTGESQPVRKAMACLSEDVDLMDQVNMVFAGCAVEYGRGKAVITETGMRTQLGRIAELIETEDVETPLQLKLAGLGKRLGALVIITCVAVFLIGLAQNVAATRMFLTSVSLAVAAIPEGLPAIVTVSLALGVQRMAKRKAIVRRLPAVETLGSATVICTDKTGTLTKGEMNIREVRIGERITVTGEGYDPTGEILKQGRKVGGGDAPALETLVLAGALCNDASLINEGGRWKVRGDTTEGTLLVLAVKAGQDPDSLRNAYPRVEEIPFDSDKKRMVTVHEHGGRRIAFLKGAPESVLSISGSWMRDGGIVPLDHEDRERILSDNNEMADRALRVLGLGIRELPPGTTTEGLERDFTYLGSVGMMDSPRRDAVEAIARCGLAGIRVIMITGDHERTARAIGAEMGIAEVGGRALTGREIERMEDEELREKAREVNVFARVSPEHKVRIVSALQSEGEIVAMTGDGVNDAPALKSADIGVAMGISGTDVAKEASDIVLADDNFATIVNAVEEGRGIYDNIRKFVAFLLSCNAGEVLAMFLASLTFVGEGMIPFLLPIQILWMNLVTDGFPALALGLEKASPHVMERPPRDPDEQPVDRGTMLRVFFLGMVLALGCLAIFEVTYASSLAGSSEAEAVDVARTAAFCAIVTSQLLLAFSMRSETESLWSIGPFTNRRLILAVAASFLIQLLVVYLPGVNQAFGCVPLSVEQWALVLLVSTAGPIGNEGWKFLVARRREGKETEKKVVA